MCQISVSLEVHIGKLQIQGKQLTRCGQWVDDGRKSHDCVFSVSIPAYTLDPNTLYHRCRGHSVCMNFMVASL